MKNIQEMGSFFFFFMLSWVLGGFFFSCRAASISLQLNDDVLGLIVFKAGIQDPTSSLSSWSEDDDSPCHWNFVQCDRNSGRVTEVSLDGLSLSGKIGRGLEKLQNLQALSLSNNNFSGTINPELARIESLRRLNLSRNSLSGSIPPSLGNMSSIQVLDFSENSLSGTIPDYVFNNCFSLRFVNLGGNSFEGSLPYTLSKCMFLGGLNLSSNHLQGDPDFVNGIWLLKRLRVLDLSNNGFSGPVPEGVAGLHNLKELHLQGNLFSGSLPLDIGFCIHLMHLDFSNNIFSGALPSSFQSLTSLSYLSLAGNNLMGELPPWIGNMKSLQYLDFSSNGFKGILPDSLGNLKLLSYLSLSHNSLSGSIPESLAKCDRLSEIRFRDNLFNGTMALLPFESLQVLDLSKNDLRGSIPPEIIFCSNLTYFNLSWNSLDSRIPPELGDLHMLSELDLRYSGLHGSIAENLCSSKSLSVLALDGNSLSGPIPQEIGSCSNLYVLSLSNNSLNGSIPSSLLKLQKLEVLNMALNKLSGEIPQELGGLESLVAVNLSYNQLTGRLPSGGIFQSLDQSSLEGNLGICSPILNDQPCKMNTPKPLVLDPNAYDGVAGTIVPDLRNSGKSKRKEFLSVSAIIAISAASLIILGVLVVTLLNVSAQRRAPNNIPIDSLSSGGSKCSNQAMGRLVMFEAGSEDWVNNAQSLLNKASEVGRGAFGTLYKATVGEGRVVAIKRLPSSNLSLSEEDFDNEVRNLARARHPNLVGLKGYYWAPQLQLLISEFVPGGSLHERLFSGKSPSLSWAIRFKIALGVAKSLAHLHHACRPTIVHYGLKPSNVLLDANCIPKLSDYGLVRLFSSLGKRGLSMSPGYMAPELTCGSLCVNEKCDVYSFGVLLLEIVSGRRAVEYREDDMVMLCEDVRSMVERGRGLECVDMKMEEYAEEEVVPLLRLGLVCTSQVPSSRPSMAEVVQILQVIKTPVPERMEVF
ncbi:hypothetical protein AMTR_s00089p00108500 [Amborella trichopoda]|uniref:non-specific serine/threonine protein kinase n=2 Tax=Amborella trichopoda TaxID=13333 RepID=W1P2I9_AMBTC|nr:hypothetical protein AMTR_s00089p00108500 [Amborella trichopoda]